MESEMNSIPPKGNLKRFLTVIEIFIIVIILAFCWSLYDHNERLQSSLAQRDTLISNMQRGDSIYKSKVKGYSEVITKYVSDCNFPIDGTKISTQELVSLLNKVINENSRLEDSLVYYKQLLNLSDSYKNQYLKKINSML